MSTIKVRDRAHWLELRRTRIGGSEIGALCGISPSMTRFELWQIKAGGLDEPDFEGDDRVFWGQVLEPAIAEGVRQKTGQRVRKVRRYFVSDSCEGLGASLDYEIASIEKTLTGSGPGPGTLEIKTVDRFIFAQRWNEELPLHYELQLQAQMACTGWDWGVVAVLIGGNELRLFDRRRHDGAIARIEAEVASFWESVRENRPPAPDWEADAKTIADLYRTADAGVLAQFKGEEGDALTQLCLDFEEARKTYKLAELRRDGLKAQILHMIGTAECALSPEWEIRAGTTKDAEVPAHVRRGHRRCDVRRRRDVRTLGEKVTAYADSLPSVEPVAHPELLTLDLEDE